MTASVFDWFGDLICPAKDKHDAQTRVTSYTLEETVNVHPELFVTSSMSVERQFRGTVACDTSPQSYRGWSGADYIRSFRKLKLKVLDVALS